MTETQVYSFTIPRDDNAENADQIGFEILGENSVLLALADGVGKSAEGAAAARIAILVALALAKTRSNSIAEVFMAAQVEIAKAAAETTGKNWSTTLTLCLVEDGQANVGHVGDSRLYHLRGAGLLTRTRDQTEVQTLIDEGVISKDRAQRYPRRNVLVSALSSDISYELYQEQFEVVRGDRLLLVSDGVYKKLSRKEISSISVNSSDVISFLGQIQAHLKTKGLVDDATALCWEVI